MRLNTKTIRTRVRLSLPVDIDRPAGYVGKMRRVDAERLAIEWLLKNPTVLRDNLRVTLRLEKDGEPDGL
jgi:hypothetical protein